MVAALLLSACDPTEGKADTSPTPAQASAPDDRDLDFAGRCPDLPAPATILGELPRQVPQLVFLWPRAGIRLDEGGCRVVARVLTVGHKGLLVTLARVEGRPQDPRPADGVEDLLSHGVALKRWVTTPDPARPTTWVEVDGAPATGKETVESLLDHLDGGRAILPGGTSVTLPAP